MTDDFLGDLFSPENIEKRREQLRQDMREAAALCDEPPKWEPIHVAAVEHKELIDAGEQEILKLARVTDPTDTQRALARLNAKIFALAMCLDARWNRRGYDAYERLCRQNRIEPKPPRFPTEEELPLLISEYIAEHTIDGPEDPK